MGRTKSNPRHCAACGLPLVGTPAAIVKHLDVCDQTAARLAGTEKGAKASLNSEIKTGTKAGTKTGTKTEIKTGTKTEIKTGTKTEIKTGTKAVVKIDTRIVKGSREKEAQFFRIHVRSRSGRYWLGQLLF